VTAFAVTAVWCAPLSGQTASARADSSVRRGCGQVIVVDLRRRSVGGVQLDTTIAVVTAALGSIRVQRRDAMPEGHQEEAYDIDFCGHRVRRFLSGIGIEDSVFRTAEGVGVGSHVATFDSAYGTPEIASEEGDFLRYTVRSAALNLIVVVPDTCYRASQGRLVGVGPNCPAKSMWFPLRRSLRTKSRPN
jgi:hypothetical protein